MQSFSRGWSFLVQAWQMALKDRDLLKPSFYALLIGFVLSAMGVIPVVGAYLLFGDTGMGRIFAFLLGALMVFLNFLVTYIFSGMTAYLIYGYLSEGDGRMDKAWDIVKRDFFDLLTLAAASTAVNMIKSLLDSNRRRRSTVTIQMSGAAAGLLETLWTEAAYLILPAMVIDDLNLKQSLERVWKIAKENLLLMGISVVGVRSVTGLIGFGLGVGGALIGLAVGYGLVAVLGTEWLGLGLGLASGLLIFFVFALMASWVNTYTGIAYHTCLYIWAREVEKAQAVGQPVQIAAPAPLAAVLG